MKKIIKRIVLFSMLLFASLWADTPVLGVVLEYGSNEPISYVKISYSSGKEVDKTTRKGRFEIMVPRSDVVLIFSKSGYESQKVDLSEFSDLMDVVITLNSNVRQLESTVTREVKKPTLKTNRDVPIDMLEDAAGMRFDLTEHLVQLPGFSGQQDFSSEISYNGSRSEDVAHYVGGMQVPNMRHLDIGFPGNLSVINPHVLKSIRIHDNPAEGPIDQGLAAAIDYIPYEGQQENFAAKLAFGMVNREVYLTGPFFIGDAFVFSFRYMDPKVLENLGQKFFTKFDREALCENCEVEGKGENFDLKSGDVYSNISGANEDGDAYNFTFLASWDDYSINQDTSSRADSIKSTAISSGEQNYVATIFNYKASSGNRWHIGWVKESVSDTIRDTADFRQSSDASFNNYLGSDKKDNNSFSFGVDVLTDVELLGADFSWVADYKVKSNKRYYSDRNANNEAKQIDNLFQGSLRMLWNSKKWKNGISIGGIAAIKNEVVPMASLSIERKFSDATRIFSGLSYRQQYVVSPYKYGDLESELKSNATADLGLGYEKEKVQLSARAYGSFYMNPALPEPEAFWFYKDISEANSAWVGGVNLAMQYRTLHHFVFATNLSSVYGEYQMKDDSYMPWGANRTIDFNTNMRYYPMADSLISIALTYRASQGKPLYAYDLSLSEKNDEGEWIDGTRELKDAEKTTSLYRTDIRVNLDLTSRLKVVWLDKIRLYIELDNLFSGFDGEWAKYLGGDNGRQRSWVTSDSDNDPYNGVELVPYMAKGMGLFFQFGVEGDFSF